MSSDEIEIFSILSSKAVPAFPGATKIFVAKGLWASFQASACSLPPEPTTNILISNDGNVSFQ